MYNKSQIKAIIKLLKSKATDGRPTLKQIFEQGGFLWATDGYVALELGEVRDSVKGKRVTLETHRLGWASENKRHHRP